MGSGGGSAPTTYNPSWQQGADQQYRNLASSTGSWASALPASVAPAYSSTLNSVLNNPNAASAMSTANQVAGLGQGVGAEDLSSASAVNGAGNAGLSAALAALQTGFDPQQALYNRTQQQTFDQANAAAAMYGLGSSPYGAGATGQTLANFNIDWQNNELSRQLAALSGYTGAASGAANDFSTGANLGSTGLNTLSASGMLPYETSQGIYGNELSALGDYTQGMVGALTPSLQQENSDLSYLGTGQRASAQNLQSWQAQQQANQSMWNGITSLFTGGANSPVSGIGNFLTSGGSGFDIGNIFGQGGMLPMITIPGT
jgi:hypothetical protein